VKHKVGKEGLVYLKQNLGWGKNTRLPRMKRLEREDYEKMIHDKYHVDLIDEVLEVFCDYPKKGKQQRLESDSYKKKYLRLYRDSLDYDFWGTDHRIMFYQEQLSNLELLKTDMIDAEEADYEDQDLVSALFTFFTIALILWFVAGPLFMGHLIEVGDSGDYTYGFLKWLEDLGSLHWAIYIFFLSVNWGIWLLAGIIHWATLTSFIDIFRRKLSAEEQKEKAISSITFKIEKLRNEIKNKGYIKRFLNA